MVSSYGYMLMSQKNTQAHHLLPLRCETAAASPNTGKRGVVGRVACMEGDKEDSVN